MRHPQDERTQNVAERRCGQVAHRDETRVARRLYRQQEVDGGYRRDEGAVQDDGCHFRQARGVLALGAEVHGMAIPRPMVPSAQDCLARRVEAMVRHRTQDGPACRVVQ